VSIASVSHFVFTKEKFEERDDDNALLGLVAAARPLLQ